MPSNSNQPGRVIAIVGSAPHAGATMIAVNLALALRQASGQSTALVDLDVRSGDSHRYLGVTPAIRGEALVVSHENDAAVEMAMITHPSGLNLLCAASIVGREPHVQAYKENADQANTPLKSVFRSIEEALARKSEPPIDAGSMPNLAPILDWLAQRYHYVVIDIPTYMLPAAHSVLDRAKNVFIIGNLYDLATINETRTVIVRIRNEAVPREKVKIILNRVNRQNRLPLAEITQTLDCAIVAQIANDSRLVSEALTSGVPLVLSNPHSAVALAITQFAKSIH